MPLIQDSFGASSPQREKLARAVAHFQQGQLNEAERICRAILRVHARNIDAAHLLGCLYLKRGQPALAEHQMRLALRIDPNNAAGHNSRGLALKDLDRLGEALASFDKAIDLDPLSTDALANRGAALHALRRFDEALASYDHAIALSPGFAGAYANRANTLVELGRFEEALASYDQAIVRQPDHADARYGRSLTRLMLGRFDGGWEDAEHRWRSPAFRNDCRTGVDPERLALWLEKNEARHKRILVVAEQGIGDEIMFAGMIPDLVRDAGGVSLECDRRLATLFARSFPEAQIVHRGSLAPSRIEEFDYRLPAGSLGRLYRNSRTAFPHRASYLKPDAAIAAEWKNRLLNLGPGLKVGISWKGGTGRTRTTARSIPLHLWGPVLELEGVRFVSLQYGSAGTDVAGANAGLSQPIAHFAPEELDDFDQLAALASALDLVITVQTALVHLCGAIGQPCWVMVPRVAEWRYGVEGSSMPWYSSVKLHRQEVRGEWGETLARVAKDLAELAARDIAATPMAEPSTA